MAPYKTRCNPLSKGIYFDSIFQFSHVFAVDFKSPVVVVIYLFMYVSNKMMTNIATRHRRRPIYSSTKKKKNLEYLSFLKLIFPPFFKILSRSTEEGEEEEVKTLL